MRFSGPEQAVRFAYNIREREIASRPNLNGAGGGSEEGLSPHELHAQGAMILAAVERLPARMRSALVSVLAPPRDPAGAQACVESSEFLWPLVQDLVPCREAVQRVLEFWTHRRGGDVHRVISTEFKVSIRQVRRWQDAISRKHYAHFLQGVDALDQVLFGEGGLERK